MIISEIMIFYIINVVYSSQLSFKTALQHNLSEPAACPPGNVHCSEYIIMGMFKQVKNSGKLNSHLKTESEGDKKLMDLILTILWGGAKV